MVAPGASLIEGTARLTWRKSGRKKQSVESAVTKGNS